MAVPGNVEFVAYCPSLSGWLILGWFGFGWDAESGPAQATLNFAGRLIVSHPVVCAFDRPDVRKLGTGAVIYIPAQRDLKGAAHDLSLIRVVSSSSQTCRARKASML